MEELKMGGNWEKNGRKWVMKDDSRNIRSGWIIRNEGSCCILQRNAVNKKDMTRTRLHSLIKRKEIPSNL